MKSQIGILALVFLLASCGATKQEADMSLQYIQSQLPKGCTFKYLGPAQIESSERRSRIFLVDCSNNSAITQNESHEVSAGKSIVTEDTITIVIDKKSGKVLGQ